MIDHLYYAKKCYSQLPDTRSPRMVESGERALSFFLSLHCEDAKNEYGERNMQYISQLELLCQLEKRINVIKFWSYIGPCAAFNFQRLVISFKIYKVFN